MIISKFACIKILNKKKLTYISKKYNIKNLQIGQTIKIPIENLPINSHEKILVKCDNCGIEKLVNYQSYNICTKNNTEKYYCSELPTHSKADGMGFGGHRLA